MKKMYILLTIIMMLIMVVSPCLAQWEKTDTGLIALRLVNYYLTKETYRPETITTYINGFPVELTRIENRTVNPLLGESPTTHDINSIYGVLLVSDLIILKQEKYPTLKKYWRIAGYTLETYVLSQNLSIKYEWNF